VSWADQWGIGDNIGRTSETLVDIKFRTRQYIPEDSELHYLNLISFDGLMCADTGFIYTFSATTIKHLTF